MGASLVDLAAGHAFPPITVTLPAAAVRAYCEAVGDEQAFYAEAGLVPPLAAAALCLGALLQEASLPPGSLHANESLEFMRPVPVGADVLCQTTLAKRSQRAGWVVSVLDSRLFVDGEAAVTAVATVLSPIEP